MGKKLRSKKQRRQRVAKPIMSYGVGDPIQLTEKAAILTELFRDNWDEVVALGQQFVNLSNNLQLRADPPIPKGVMFVGQIMGALTHAVDLDMDIDDVASFTQIALQGMYKVLGESRRNEKPS